MLIFDGHLDLAMMAIQYERDLLQTVGFHRKREVGVDKDERGDAVVSFPEMRAGNVLLCVTTLLGRAKPWIAADRRLTRGSDDWPHPSMVHGIGHAMMAYYRWLERAGHAVVIETAEDYAKHVAAAQSSPDTTPIGMIITMEGADGVTAPDEIDHWHDAGLRTLNLAHFGRSFYAHGTPSNDASNTHDVDGPLLSAADELFRGMERLGMPLDLSHLSDQSLAGAFARFGGQVYASHSGCRSIVGNNQGVHPQRNITDDHIRAIVERGGVVGIPLYNRFIEPDYDASLNAAGCKVDRVVDHLRTICDIAGDTAHAAIGSDLDGGFGRDRVPHEIDTIADLPRIGEAMERAGFTAADAEAILGGNWLRFWGENLPSEAGS
ncbi:MAG: membrane dipeptidase [Planctomycetota bacterium]